jgi:large subunit ribosomal protein L35
MSRWVDEKAAGDAWARSSFPHGADGYHTPAMPKMKTHSGAKKRFKITAGGKVRGRHAMRSHILGKKNAKRRRRLDAPMILSDSEKARVKALLRK